MASPLSEGERGWLLPWPNATETVDADSAAAFTRRAPVRTALQHVRRRGSSRAEAARPDTTSTTPCWVRLELSAGAARGGRASSPAAPAS
eukprot:scaffold266_cov391-Prasinococcus_capsulatus_cf.AAC.20